MKKEAKKSTKKGVTIQEEKKINLKEDKKATKKEHVKIEFTADKEKR